MSELKLRSPKEAPTEVRTDLKVDPLNYCNFKWRKPHTQLGKIDARHRRS